MPVRANRTVEEADRLIGQVPGDASDLALLGSTCIHARECIRAVANASYTRNYHRAWWAQMQLAAFERKEEFDARGLAPPPSSQVEIDAGQRTNSGVPFLFLRCREEERESR